MIVWLDILTPKQLFFLNELGRRLEARGHDVFRTTRQYREVDDLVKMRNEEILSVGRYGGATLEEKLAASANRIERLSHIINKLDPDVSVAFASPDAARTAFGLGIPHFTANDSPHSIFVARLTIPISLKLFSPKVIPQSIWLDLGTKPNQIIQYNALDPVAWLKTFNPDPNVLKELSLDTSIPIIVFRLEEAFASYLLGYSNVEKPITISTIDKIQRKYGKHVQIVVLPRYAEQISVLKKIFHDTVIIPKKAIDGPSLLSYATVFIGAGGTMTAESALLGTPTLSCYPGETTIVEKYLIGKKLVERITNLDETSDRIIQILNEYKKIRLMFQRRAKTLMSQMEDPIKVMIDEIEKLEPKKAS